MNTLQPKAVLLRPRLELLAVISIYQRSIHGSLAGGGRGRGLVTAGQVETREFHKSRLINIIASTVWIHLDNGRERLVRRDVD